MSRSASAMIGSISLLVLTGPGGGAASSAESLSLSPDVTIDISSTIARDEAVVVDNLLGMVVPANLGALPEASDVSGYELLPGGDQLLCFP